MISCVISDLDGTLLPHGKSALSTDVLDTISALQNKGIAFCVASGRSYVQLKSLFSSLKKPIYYICCDGALCVYKENTLFETPFSSFPDLKENQIAYGKYIVYATDKNEPFYRDTIKAYNGHVLPFSQAKNDKIYKLALYREGIKNIDGLYKILRTNDWQEYVNTGVSKGVAVNKLQKLLNITPEQTLILGDAKNDLPMTSFGTSVLIGNGFFGAKSHFKYQAKDFMSAIENYCK